MTAVTDRDLTTIQITGEIDACNVNDLTANAREAVPEGSTLILDLAGVDFIAVAGLRALLAMNIECARCGTTWALIAGPAVSRLLRIGDPDHTLPVVGSALEAVLQIRRVLAANRHLRAVTGR
jgi:anti-anti-sigma factor